MADSLLGGIVINEILVDPNGAQNFDTDGNGTADGTDEYIELYNSAGVPIDISGLQLWDAGVGHWFTFPPGTVLEPGGHAMVMSGVQSGGTLPTGGADDLFFDAGRGSPLINNGGDNVVLYDPGSDEYIQAVFNGDTLDDPTAGGGGYAGFSGTATQQGTGEDFGNDTDGQSLQREGDGTDNFTSDGPTPGTKNVCFANGTGLMTPTGEVAVEDLRAGDMLVTGDHGAQPITWIYAKRWSAQQVAQAAHLAPVLIRADALGPGLPKTALRLSQLHRVLVHGPIAQRMFGSHEVLIPARALLGLPGVDLDQPEAGVTYFHVMLERHEVIYAEGLATESLYLGPFALKAMPEAAIVELEQLLGQTREAIEQRAETLAAARPLERGPRAKRLIAKHKRREMAVGQGVPAS